MHPIRTAGVFPDAGPYADRPWWAEFVPSKTVTTASVTGWALGFVAGCQAVIGSKGLCFEIGEAHERLWVLVHNAENSDGSTCRYLPQDILEHFRPTEAA